MSDWDIVLRGGRVIDPESGLDAVADVAIEGGRVAEIGPGLGAARAEADVTGQVVTAAGQPLAAAKVTISSQEDGKIRSIVTDDKGYYRITYLPPGQYRISASLDGYKEGTIQGFIVPLGEITYLRLPNITLYPVSAPQPATPATPASSPTPRCCRRSAR